MKSVQKLLPLLLTGLCLGAAHSALAAGPESSPLPTLVQSKEAAKDNAASLDDETLVTINGLPITRTQLAIFVTERTRSVKAGSEISPKVQSAALNEMINIVLMAQAAEKTGLAGRPEVLSALELQRLQFLARLTANDVTSSYEPKDEEVEALYKERFGSESITEYKARHILVKTEEEAKAVIAELDKGGNFDEVAKAHAAVPGGGDLGWFQTKSMVKPFADAVTTMAKGSYSKQPVQTQFGWHVIILDDSRQSPPPSLDQVKPKLLAEMRQKVLSKYVSELQKGANVQANEKHIASQEELAKAKEGDKPSAAK